MSNIKIIQGGDIRDSQEKYIVHQTNCITTKSAHLAKTIFDKFPHADIYKPRIQSGHRDKPGTIIIKGDGKSKRYVINLLGQYYPSKSKFNNDTVELRQKWFKMGLTEILKIPNLTSIAFPWNIGCGSAGGDWDDYYEMIKQFAKKTNAKIVIYNIMQE